MNTKQIENTVNLLKRNPISKINQFINMYPAASKKQMAEYLGCTVDTLAVTLSTK